LAVAAVAVLKKGKIYLQTVFRIRIHRIHMFLGLPDPDQDPLVRGVDPDPSIILLSSSKIVR
jgi:hypothetical protein